MEPNEHHILHETLAATQAKPWAADELSALAQQAIASDQTLRKIPEPRPGTRRSITSRPTPAWRGRITNAVITASVVAIAGLGWLAFQQSQGTLGSQTTQQYVTQRAQRATVPLPDGSQAILGPDTRMTYAESPSGERMITLSGQAYFTVTHDPSRQFTVNVRGVTTRVLGTAFSVRGYTTDARTQVAVAEGKVALETAQDATVLASGEVGEASEQERPRVVRNARINDVFGWMRGQIAFDDAPMRDIVPELSRFLDVDIAFSDPSIAGRPVTIVISEGNTNTALDAIALAIDARYTRSGNTIVFSPRGSR